MIAPESGQPFLRLRRNRETIPSYIDEAQRYKRNRSEQLKQLPNSSSPQRGRRTISLIVKRPRGGEDLFRRVRRLALRQQADGPQQFISLRKAAGEFGVKMAAMAAVYRRLTAEGILSSIRGSHTILVGRNHMRTLRLRGLIGIPVSTHRLAFMRAHRDCFLCLRSELQARGFAVVPLFFHGREVAPQGLTDLARREKLDVVIWPQTEGHEHDAAQRLRDFGIQFIGINIGGLVPAFCRYEVRREKAVRLVLQDWRAGGKLTKAVYVRANEESSRERTRTARLSVLAQEERMEFAFATVPKGQITRTLRSLCAPARTGLLLPAAAAAMLGSRAPDVIATVLGKCRVALLDGPMEFPFLQEPLGVKIDLVRGDWPHIGRRIARDILSGDAFRQDETHAFEAKAQLRVSLGDLGSVLEARAARPSKPRSSS